MKYIVYQTINLKNNKQYLGVHKTLDPNVFDSYLGCGIRVNNPSTYNNPTTPLQYAVKKYGTSAFRRSTLKIFDTAKEAFDLEKELVNEEFIKRPDVYNAKIGGLGGASYFVKINQFDLNGKFLKTWDSILEAADFYGISDTAISNADKYKGSCKGYFWSRNNTFIDISEYKHYQGQMCYKYSKEGKYLDTYNSLVEAAKDNNVPLQSIQRAVKGGYKVGDFYYSLEIMEEYIKKPKISLKGKTLYIYSLNGDFITELHNSSEITNFFNIKSTNPVTTAMRTGRQYKDYQLSLEKVDKLEPIEDKRNKHKKVAQYSLTGNLIKEFNSITEACKEFGTGVQKVVRGQQKQCKGFIFRIIS